MLRVYGLLEVCSSREPSSAGPRIRAWWGSATAPRPVRSRASSGEQSRYVRSITMPKVTRLRIRISIRTYKSLESEKLHRSVHDQLIFIRITTPNCHADSISSANLTRKNMRHRPVVVNHDRQPTRRVFRRRPLPWGPDNSGSRGEIVR